jgi:hypothetical protein
LASWELVSHSNAFCPIQAERTIVEKFDVAFGDVSLCVARTEMSQLLWTVGLRDMCEAEATENVETALGVSELLQDRV